MPFVVKSSSKHGGWSKAEGRIGSFVKETKYLNIVLEWSVRTYEIVKMFDIVDLLSSKDVVFLSIMFSDASFTPTDRQQVNTDKLFFFFFFFI